MGSVPMGRGPRGGDLVGGVPAGVPPCDTPSQALSLREQLSRRRSGLEDAPSDGDTPV